MKPTKFTTNLIVSRMIEKSKKISSTNQGRYRYEMLKEMESDLKNAHNFKDAKNIIHEKKSVAIAEMISLYAEKGDSNEGELFRHARERYLTLVDLNTAMHNVSYCNLMSDLFFIMSI